MITTSAYGIVVLLIILHTILTHLITWGFRSAVKKDYVLSIMGLIVLSIAELVLLMITLDYYI
jgi:hypothetical protein